MSVIVPVYNTEAYVDACLESIQSQTVQDIEILCVDDGSTDGSLATLEARAGADRRIHVIQRTAKDRGPGAARNLAIERARGEYLAFVDSDDRIQPNMLERLTSAASKHAAEVAMCMFRTFDDTMEYDTECRFDRVIPHELDDVPFTWRDIEAAGLFQLRFASCNKIYAREFLERREIRYSEDRFYEDLIFTFRAMLEAESLAFVREPLYLNRKDRSGATTFDQGDRVFDALQSMEELRAMLSSRSDYQHLLPAFDGFEFNKLRRYLPKNDITHITQFYNELRTVAQRPSLAESPLLTEGQQRIRSRIATSNLFEYLVWHTWYADRQRIRQNRRHAQAQASRQELLARVRQLREENRQLVRENRRLLAQQSFRRRWKLRLKRLLGERGTAVVRRIVRRNRA